MDKFNFDTGAAETAFPKEMATSEFGNSGVTYKTAIGELVPGYGSGHLGGTDENTKYWKLGGEFTDVHKILVSAGAVHNKGHFSWLEAGGGYVIPIGSKVGKELRDAQREILDKYGTQELLPLWEENGVYNFYLKNVQSSSRAAEGSGASSSTSRAPMDIGTATSGGGAPGEPRHAPQMQR